MEWLSSSDAVKVKLASQRREKPVIAEKSSGRSLSGSRTSRRGSQERGRTAGAVPWCWGMDKTTFCWPREWMNAQGCTACTALPSPTPSTWHRASLLLLTLRSKQSSKQERPRRLAWFSVTRNTALLVGAQQWLWERKGVISAFGERHQQWSRSKPLSTLMNLRDRCCLRKHLKHGSTIKKMVHFYT